VRRIRRALRRLARAHRPAPAAPALGCSEAVAQSHAWARLEAERLLADDEIAGVFMIGDNVDAPPPVIAEMEAIIRERERRYA